MAIPVPGVFITTNLEVITNAFFGNVKYSSFNSLKSDLAAKGLDDYIITSPGKNSNLLEFKYSWGGSKENVDSCMFVAKFLDHAYNLEEKFLNDSHYHRLYKNLIQAGTTAFLKTDDVKVREQVKDSLDGLPQGFNPGIVYIAFGLGEKLDNWSGPFIAELVNANVEYPNGIKEITFKFAALGKSMISNVLISKEINALEYAVDRYSRLRFLSQRIQFKAEVQTNYIQLRLDPYKYIKFCLDNYISQMGKTPNVISLLPFDFKGEMDSYFNNTIKDSDTPLGNVLGAADMIPYILNSYFSKWGFYVHNKAPDKRPVSTLGNPIYEMMVESAPVDLSDITLAMKVDKELTQEVNDKGKLNSIPDPFIALDRVRSQLEKSWVAKHPEPFNAGFEPSSLQTGVAPFNYFTPKVSLARPREEKPDFTPLRLIEETNIKILRLWEKYGFIQDSSRSALIFGPQDALQQILYPTTLGISYKVYNELDRKFYNEAYRQEFIRLNTKDRTRSSFEEVTNIQTDDLDVRLTNAIGLAAASNIPIFRFNAKNANVQSITVGNQGAYIGALTSTYKKMATLMSARYAIPFLSEDNKSLFKDKFIETLGDKFNQISSGSGITSFITLRDNIEKYLLDNQNFQPEKIYFTPRGLGNDNNVIGTTYGDIGGRHVYKYLDQSEVGRYNTFGGYEPKDKYSQTGEFNLFNNPNVWKNIDTFKTDADDADINNIITSKEEDVSVLDSGLNNEDPSAKRFYEVYGGKELKKSINTELDNSKKNNEFVKKYNDFVSKVNSHKAHGSISQYATILASILWMKTHSSIQPEILMEEGNFQTLNHFEEELYKMSQPVSIKTLPFFQIASCGDLGKDALMIAYNNKLVGTQFQPRLAFFSGIYKITAFSHVITGGECYSEFGLIKASKTLQPKLI